MDTLPRYCGFDGVRFDFAGDVGKYYAILSTGTLQVNARMKTNDFIFVDEIDVVVGSAEVGTTKIKMGLDVDKKQNSIIHLGDGKVNRDPVYFASGLKYKSQDPALGCAHRIVDTLYLETGNCMIVVKRDEHDRRLEGIPHIKMQISVMNLGMCSDGIMPHGVLGQTLDLNRIRQEGVLEGTYSDYEVEPFGTNFKFNRFGTTPTIPPISGKFFGLVACL